MTTSRPKSRKAAASSSAAPAVPSASRPAPAPAATKAAKPKAKAKAKPKVKRGGTSVAPAPKKASSSAPALRGDASAPVDAGAPEAEAAEAPKRSRTGTLLIVESPAKAKTIQKYLGRGFTVVASKGHVKDLPKRGGVDIEQGFKETYEVIQEKGKDEVLRTIRDLSKRADRVLLATDPDREGEAIAWHLLEEIKHTRPEVEVRRVLFNEITKKGVNDGIAHPRDLDPYLYEAQRTRRVLDRIGGYPLSNLLWRKLAFGLSAGRVQTPALRILVDRQHEIDAFVPVPYWLLEAKLAGPLPPSFVASLDSVGGEKLERVASRPACTSELDAKRFEADLRAAAYKVAGRARPLRTRRRSCSRTPATAWA
jgi:DNA topoisomerase-1